MSKIKELRNSDENNINIIKMFNQMLVSDKTKYVEMFRKLVSNRFENHFSKKELFEDLYSRLPDLAFSDDMTFFEIMFTSTLINWTDTENVRTFNQFIEYNERTLIEKNDLTTYKSFDEVSCEISKVDLKMITKEMESQVISLHSDEEWLVIKPLTYESSKKYGSNTKWCTTSANNPEYFFRYTKNGILIYCVNRKTGYKVAAFKDLKERDISFWNQKDERIDSFYTDLPDNILSILRKELMTCKKSNALLIDSSAREKEMMKYYKEKEKIRLDDLVEAPVPRRIHIGNRFDGAEQEQPVAEMGGMDMGAEMDGGDMDMTETQEPMEQAPMEEMAEEVVNQYRGRNEGMGLRTAERGVSRGPELTRDQIYEFLTDNRETEESPEPNGRTVDMVARINRGYEEDAVERG